MTYTSHRAFATTVERYWQNVSCLNSLHLTLIEYRPNWFPCWLEIAIATVSSIGVLVVNRVFFHHMFHPAMKLSSENSHNTVLSMVYMHSKPIHAMPVFPQTLWYRSGRVEDHLAMKLSLENIHYTALTMVDVFQADTMPVLPKTWKWYGSGRLEEQRDTMDTEAGANANMNVDGLDWEEECP